MITPEERAADEAVIARATAQKAKFDDVIDYRYTSAERWPAYVEALREAEARIAKLEDRVMMAEARIEFDALLCGHDKHCWTKTGGDAATMQGESGYCVACAHVALKEWCERLTFVYPNVKAHGPIPIPDTSESDALRAENAKLKAALEEVRAERICPRCSHRIDAVDDGSGHDF